MACAWCALEPIAELQHFTVARRTRRSRCISAHSPKLQVVPYQIWMLQRLEETLLMDQQGALPAFLASLRLSELLELPALLEGARVRKQGGLIFSI